MEDVRVDKSKYTERIALVLKGDAEFDIPFRVRQWTGMERNDAVIAASRRVKAEGLDTAFIEIFKQQALVRIAVSEINGEAMSDELMANLDDDVEMAVRTELFGAPGEYFLQGDLIKNLAPKAEDLRNQTHSELKSNGSTPPSKGRRNRASRTGN